jgi:hypothetical protein
VVGVVVWGVWWYGWVLGVVELLIEKDNRFDGQKYCLGIMHMHISKCQIAIWWWVKRVWVKHAHDAHNAHCALCSKSQRFYVRVLPTLSLTTI